MHPRFAAEQRVRAVIGLENPAAPHNPDVPPLTEYREMGERHFMHIEYFRVPPRADRDLAAAPRRFLHICVATRDQRGTECQIFAEQLLALAEPLEAEFSRWLERTAEQRLQQLDIRIRRIESRSRQIEPELVGRLERSTEQVPDECDID